jgi:hypothetical protein
MRKIYAFRDGKFVELTPNSSSEQHTAVIDDTMPPTRHPIDGKIYESKSVFRQITKAAGCEEVGNEPIRERIPYKNHLAREERIAFLRETTDKRHLTKSEFQTSLETFGSLMGKLYGK